MKFCSAKIVLLISFLVAGIVSSPASAAGSKPKFNISCGQITGGVDENGTYGLFKPKISVSYYGKPLSVIAYFYETPSTPKSDAGQSIWEITGRANSSTYFKSNLELERKILTFNMPQTGYYKIVFEAIDSLKRKGTYSCTYKNYYFDTPVVDPSTGYSNNPSTGYSNKGLNKTSCTFKGKKLYGSVYFTNSSVFADFSVYVTNSSAFSDLNVYLTGSSIFASSCGLWYQTTSSVFADFSVYITNSSAFSDFSIYLTNSSIFAGVN